MDIEKFQSYYNTFGGHVKTWKASSMLMVLKDIPEIAKDKKRLTDFLLGSLLMEGFKTEEVELIRDYIMDQVSERPVLPAVVETVYIISEKPQPYSEHIASHRTGTLVISTKDRVADIIGFPANRAGCLKTGMEWAFTYKGHKCAIWSYKGSHLCGELSTFGPASVFKELFGDAWFPDQ